MTNDLTTLTYAEGITLRAAQTGGQTIVCLADLAHGLGIVDVSRLASRLPDGARRTHPIVAEGLEKLRGLLTGGLEPLEVPA